MIDIRIEDGGVPEALLRGIRALSRPEAALRDYGRHEVRRARQRMFQAPHSQSAAEGQPPLAHRKEFWKSLDSEVPATAQYVRIGSSSIRARILQEGGVIRPVRARALAVPAVDQDESLYGKRPADVPNLRYVPLKGHGGMVGMLVRERGGSTDVAFRLFSRVRIRPHPWLPDEPDWDYLTDAIGAQFDRELRIAR